LIQSAQTMSFRNIVIIFPLRYNLINSPDVPYTFQNVRHISFNNAFDKNIYALNHLPNIDSIVFGHYFDQPVDNLPKTITSLTFGHSFNRSVDNLPKTITSLTFGHNFNRPADKLPTARENNNIINFWSQL
jgi:hypothetical protein